MMSWQRHNIVSEQLFRLALVLTVALHSSSRCLAQPPPARNIESRATSVLVTARLPSELRLNTSEIHFEIAVKDPKQFSEILRVHVHSSWVLGTGTSNISLIGFFDERNAAMSDTAGHAIPASYVLGGIDGEAMAPFTEHGHGNASLTMFRERITPSNIASARADTINLELAPIDLLRLPAAEYQGTLHLRLISY